MPEKAFNYYKYLKIKPDSKLLDIACGDGRFLANLNAKHYHPEIYGVDVSDRAIALGYKRLLLNPKSGRLQVAYAENLPFEDCQFDYVTCIGSIEHFDDEFVALKEAYRVGKPNCHYLFICPNRYSWKENKTTQAEYREVNRSLEEWRSLFTGAGFRNIRVKRDMFFRKGGWWKRWLLYLMPLNRSHNFVFIFQK